MILSETLERLKRIQQRPDHHPEGDVFTHIAIVTRRVLFLGRGEVPELFAAAILHDVGKLTTTSTHPKKGHITHHGHEKASEEFIIDHRCVLQRIFPDCDLDLVTFLVRHHHRARDLSVLRPMKRQTFLDECSTFEHHALVPFVALCQADDMLIPCIGDTTHAEARVFLEKFVVTIRRHEHL